MSQTDRREFLKLAGVAAAGAALASVAGAQTTRPATAATSHASAIARDFGSFAAFKDQFSAAAKSVEGSGWRTV